MLRKHMAMCLVATALATAPAFAQSPSAPTDRPTATGSGSTTSGSPAMNPGSSATGSSSGSSSSTMGSGSTTGTSGSTMGTSGSTTAGSTASSGNFVTQQQPGQLLASKLIGTTVVGQNNESIGDVNDILVDRNGQIQAVVIGVGGFLGIGEKDVAVSFRSLEFASRNQAPGTAGTASSSAGSSSTGSTSTTGTTGTASSTASTNPDRIILRMTKADLQAAPTFHNANRSSSSAAGSSTSTGGSSTGTSSTGTSAPR